MIAWIALALRRIRDERLSALGVVGLVFVTAFVAAATPRQLDHIGDDTLQSTVAGASAATSNIQFVRDDSFLPVGNDPLFQITSTDEQLFDTLPSSIAKLVSARAWTMDSGRWQVPQLIQLTGDAGTMRMRIQPDAMDRLELVSGRWPTGATTETPDATSPDEIPPSLTTFEVVLSEQTAADFQVDVGAMRTLVADTTDELMGAHATARIAVQVVGIYRVKDEADPWWLNDSSLARPAIRIFGDLTIFDGTALAAPEAYAAYVTETRRETQSPLLERYTFREYLDPSRFHAAAIGALLVDFKRLETAYPSTLAPLLQNNLGRTTLRGTLRALLELFQARWASATAILMIGGIGPGVVALGALALVVGFAAQRRRSALALARGRGASLGQTIAAIGVEGLLLAAPATAVAAGIAIAAIPSTLTSLSIAAAGAVAAVTVILLIVAAIPATNGPAFGSGAEARAPARPSVRRLLFEGLVVVLAVAGAVLLRERGVRGASSAGELGQADPFVAAVPALAGLAAGLLAMRLFPLPMRFFAWLAARGRGLVPMLALRRASTGSRVGATLVVVLVTAAVWAFSSSILVYFNRASEAVAWHDVGAAYRIESSVGRIDEGFDPAALPGVEASASATLAKVNMGSRRLNVELVSLDVGAYDRVTAGTPAALTLPLDLYATDVSTIPIVVSRSVAERADGVRVGDEFLVLLNGHKYPMKVIGVVDDLPAFDAGAQFAIASREQMRAVDVSSDLLASTVASTIFLRASPEAGPAIRQAVEERLPNATVLSSRAEVTAALRDSPTARAVVAGTAAGALVAFLYAVLAVAAGLALTGAAQAVEVAHLRTMGLSNRQLVGLVIAEHGPVVVAALIAGLALGLGLFVFLREGLGLDALVGAQADVSLVPDPTQLAAVLGGIVAVAVLGLGLGTIMQRGTTSTAAQRRGFE